MASFHVQASPVLYSKEIGLQVLRQPSAWLFQPLRGRKCGRKSSLELGISVAGLSFAERLCSSVSTGGSVIRPRASALQQIERLDEVEMRKGNVSPIDIRTLRGCGLGIAWYPDFVYNAEGGGGTGAAEELEDGGLLAVEFDVNELHIPSLGFATATFLGLPLPPFIRIDVAPQHLKGFIDRATGKVELQFSAKFLFSVGSLYRPPPLMVETLLTTEQIQGIRRRGQGKRLDAQGECRLVGIASVAPIEDAFMNSFLNLPTECLANMVAKFIFSSVT